MLSSDQAIPVLTKRVHSFHGEILSQRSNIKARVILPLGLSFLVLLGAAISGIHWLEDQNDDGELGARLVTVQMLLHKGQEETALNLVGFLNLITEDEQLVRAWSEKDHEALLKKAVGFFHDILADYGVAHFSFITPNKTCFLRVHDPQNRDDTTDSITLDRAIRTGKPAHGLEVTPEGHLLLQVVYPWNKKGHQPGYIILGQKQDRRLSGF